MTNRCLLIILVLFLNSCGIGVIGIQIENKIFRNDKPINHKNDFLFEHMNFGFVTNVYNTGKKENMRVNKNFNDINIYMYTYKNSKFKIISFGLLPLVPAPPIIPTFFFPAMGYKEFCGGENYKIELIFESEFNILDNIEIDLNSIYLLKDNKKIYTNDYTNELKTHENAITKKIDSYKKIFIINFPITCKETNNSLIFVNNIKIDNRNVNLPVGKIMYNSSWGFMMGYFINN